MNDSLALKYRPRTFDDLVGQRVVQVVLRQMLTKRRIPAALILDGPRGTGKTTTLRLLAADLNCHHSDGSPCGTCPSCTAVFDGTSLNLVEIDAASHGLVDDIRRLRSNVGYAVTDGWRVIGLDEAQSISGAGFNALLKILEEPPPNTLFVLLTTEPQRIPETIQSRCMRFTYRRITVADIAARLAHVAAVEDLNVEPALLTLIAERADGGMRDALMLLDQATTVGITTVEQYTEHMGDTDPGPTLLDVIRGGNPAHSFAAVTAALAGAADPHTIANALVGALRDVCILRAGGDLTAQGTALDVRRNLADHIDGPTAFAALRILWDVKTKIRAGDDPRTALDLAVVMLTDVFAPAAPTAPAATGRRLTFAELTQRR